MSVSSIIVALLLATASNAAGTTDSLNVPACADDSCIANGVKATAGGRADGGTSIATAAMLQRAKMDVQPEAAVEEEEAGSSEGEAAVDEDADVEVDGRLETALRWKPGPSPTPTPPTPKPPTPTPGATPKPTPAATPKPTEGATSPPGATKQIKFMEWNVHWQNRNTKGLAKVIAKTDPDILGLDEFQAKSEDMLKYLNRESPHRNYHAQTGRDYFKGFDTFIVYDSNKWDIVDGHTMRIHESWCGSKGGHRGASVVVLKDRQHQGAGGMLITGGLHTSYCEGGCDGTMECEIGKLYDKFEEAQKKYPGAPVIWMGDLNRGYKTTIIKNLKSGKLGRRSVLKVQDMAETKGRTYYNGGSAIDWILGEEWRFRRIDGGRSEGCRDGHWCENADHLPIYALVEWDPSGTPFPSPAPTCYGELPGGKAEEEGDSIDSGSERYGKKAEDCQDGCDDNEQCQSFTLCPSWSKCYLKRKSFSGNEPAKSHHGCKTYFKKAC